MFPNVPEYSLTFTNVPERGSAEKHKEQENHETHTVVSIPYNLNETNMDNNDLITYVSRALEAYGYMSKRVERLEREMDRLKGKGQKTDENPKQEKNDTMINTKYRHMKVLIHR